jgi:hypothetical protein
VDSVQRSHALASAVAAADPRAARAAVTAIVFNHLHIVRLRVTRGGRLLADMGGPLVLAPVRGSIRWHGRVVGRFVLSIQDDLGYLLLARRLAGVDTVMSRDGRPAMSSLNPAPASIPREGVVSVAGVSYLTDAIDATAFPGGPLRISLLIRRPDPSFALRTCTQIQLAALGSVAANVSRRFRLAPGSYRPYILVTHHLTHGLVFVRTGVRWLSGSVRPGPATLPLAGTVNFEHATHGVFSFATHTAVGRAIRIFLLVRR